MKPSIEDIRAFVQVAELKSFHEAATALFLTPSALSRRISKLEEYIGINLFDRTTQKVELTITGRSIFDNSRTLINDFDRFDKQLLRMAKREESLVEIACLTTVAGYILPKLIAAYRRQNPGVRFVVRDGTGMSVAEQVQERRVEFAIGIQTPETLKLKIDKLVDDPFYLACLSEHPLAQKNEISWNELSDHTVIVLGSETSANRRIVDTELVRHNIVLEWSDEVQSLSTQTGFVEHGIGSAVFPGLAFPFFLNSEVLKIPLVAPTISRQIVLMKHHKYVLSPAAADFYSYLQTNFINTMGE